VTAVFADTFYWAALTSEGDAAHERAVEFSRSLQPGAIMTTENVLDEYLTYFSGARQSMRIQAGNTVADILGNSGILVIPQSHQLFLAGLKYYRARPDKGYSLTDCTSMEVMHRYGLTNILTNDRHFEQEGFRALFRS
jgi:predicted nucleic acid-binding protein